MRTTRIFSCLVLAIILGGTAQVSLGDTWSKANQEYAAGHFKEAADLYQRLAQTGETSAALYYNLGNAYYRLDNFGRAILSYERALAVDPHQPEAESNLRLARDKAHALELHRGRLEGILARAKPAQYTIAAALGFWIAAFTGLALLFSQRRSGVLLIGVFLGLAIMAGAGAGLYFLDRGPDGRALAIVITKSVEARLATADSAGTVLALPAGSEVKILSTRGDWSYAALPNDLRGWIPANSAERVRL